MSLNLKVNKIFRALTVLLFISTAICFFKVSDSERKFLSYPKEADQASGKTIPVEIKGSNFFVTQEENESYNFNKTGMFILFVVTVVVGAFSYKDKIVKKNG